MTDYPSLPYQLSVRKQSRKLPCDFIERLVCWNIRCKWVIEKSICQQSWINLPMLSGRSREALWKWLYIAYRGICWLDPFILWFIFKTKISAFFLFPYTLELEQSICNTFSFFHSAWLRSLCSSLSQMWARLYGLGRATRELHSECLTDTGFLCAAQSDKTIPTTNSR